MPDAALVANPGPGESAVSACDMKMRCVTLTRGIVALAAVLGGGSCLAAGPMEEEQLYKIREEIDDALSRS